jgi:hypothetical protein
MANSSGWGDGAANNTVGWGQGANNTIGWGSSHATSWAGATDIVGLATDADAQAFITAAVITDPTQITAINNLVVGLKTDGIWTKMKAIYPFVGGTATTHKYNLKDPRDLDAAFRLVFNGGWTHSSTGATPNGTNGYADTKLICQTSMFGKDYNFGYYSRTDSDGVLADIGNFYTVGTSSSSLSALTRLGNTLYLDSPNESLRVTAVNNNSLGYYISNNATSIGRNVFKNNSKIINTAFSNNDFPIQVNPNIALSASHIGNIQGGRFSNRQLAFANFGSALTDTEVTALNSRIITFQTALSRQV